MNQNFTIFYLLSFFNYLNALSLGNSVIISDIQEEASKASVAINAQGDMAISWIGKRTFQESIQAALKKNPGQWSNPSVLSKEREKLHPPHCFLSDEGDTYVIWKNWIGDQAEYVQKPTYQDWTNPIPLDLDLSRYCNFIFDGKGRFLFLCAKEESELFLKKTMTAQLHLKKADQSAEEIFTIPGAEHGWFDQPKISQGIAIGINSLGDTFIVWNKFLNNFNSSLYGCWLPPYGSFTSTEELSGSTPISLFDCFLSAIAIDNRKNVTLVGVKQARIQVLTRIDDHWSDWTSLSDEDQKNGSWFRPRPQVAVDIQGNILVVWKTITDDRVYIEGAYKGYKQNWNLLGRIDIEGEVDKILLRSDNKENFVVLWEEKKDRKSAGIYAVEVCDQKRMWSSLIPLSNETEFCCEPSLEFSKNGRGILAWTKKASNFDSWIEVMDLLLGQ